MHVCTHLFVCCCGCSLLDFVLTSRWAQMLEMKRDVYHRRGLSEGERRRRGVAGGIATARKEKMKRAESWSRTGEEHEEQRELGKYWKWKYNQTCLKIFPEKTCIFISKERHSWSNMDAAASAGSSIIDFFALCLTEPYLGHMFSQRKTLTRHAHTHTHTPRLPRSTNSGSLTVCHKGRFCSDFTH